MASLLEAFKKVQIMHGIVNLDYKLRESVFVVQLLLQTFIFKIIANLKGGLEHLYLQVLHDSNFFPIKYVFFDAIYVHSHNFCCVSTSL